LGAGTGIELAAVAQPTLTLAAVGALLAASTSSSSSIIGAILELEQAPIGKPGRSPPSSDYGGR
jgi:hypothetical protein